VRSSEVEQIIGLTADPFNSARNTYDTMNDADMKFPDATGTDGKTYTTAQGTFDTLMDNPDRDARRTAWEGYMDTYIAFKNTYAANLITSVKQDVFNMRARKYESCLAASLFDNNIPVEVFDNLINTFKKNIPTWHKYWAVRRKALGVDTLNPYDIWAPIANSVPVSYQQAVDWVCEGLKPLGSDYVNALRRGCLEDRWVDIYPNQGKRSGAFSDGAHATFPFIMMSFDNSMNGLSTLAHELGHSLHSYHSRKNQHINYSGYSLFVAEVASNFNQALTRAYLREEKKDDANFQIALIEEAMSNFHRYFFIMPTLARFELEVHQRVEKGMGVTADDMIELMADLFSEGYGNEMHVDRERVGMTWATFGHLYAAFYVYQYATGISAAHALADKVIHGGDAAKRYVEFLSLGSSVYPLDALKHAGVDMTSPAAVETTFGVLSDMVDRLEQLTG
jgi:oligoendopeptidase F